MQKAAMIRKNITINNMLKNLTDDVIKSQYGFGIRNVNDRLRILFSNDYDMYYESIEGEETKVHIILPIITDPDDIEEGNQYD